ncbi:NUMOD1 domain-containing DNA-binding protein [uncultured Maribacter sp.]|uniref:NUMOD1 domain-containing DNA-binding protein n=1 Tax=uncultured Maribacter sp. TaxID=431308 RepID=UPI00261F8FAD|nr:NUMOD1 domain-containing DNA-binding protein [uncultured Maribacter sp.]
MSDKIVYRVVNKKTSQTYVGTTTKSIDARKIDHEQKANIGKGSYFQEAIGTYGPDAFEWEQIDTANDVNELAEKEKQYILKYNSLKNGYNQDSGGGIQKNVYQYNSTDGTMVGVHDSLKSAALSVSASRTSISNTCLGQNKTCKGFYWSYTLTEPFIIEGDLRKKKVVQYDLEGKQIAIFESVAEANRSTGISKTCISRCCRGERRSSAGFLWKYN